MMEIAGILETYYSLKVTLVTLLSVGADLDASLYKVEAEDQNTYFVKVKHGDFQEIGVEVLREMEQAGISHLLLPIKTKEGKEVQKLEDSTLIVYPFVEGENGFTVPLNDAQWAQLGKTMRHIHTMTLSKELKAKIRKEDFSPKWRNKLRSFYEIIDNISTQDDLGVKAFLQTHKKLILDLVDQAEKLSPSSLSFVLCHSDIHAGNILIQNEETFYIIDWDNPILAPKERDLMFIGGGVGNVWNKASEEKAFYQGYQREEINRPLLAYYRYERIIEDIAIYAEELLLKQDEGQNREEIYGYLMSLFEPNGVIDIARKTLP